jgi:heme A synthase
MKTLARVGAAAVTLTYLHLVFGGIVRITGSGMGCGDHWPKCNGSWIPPFDSPLVMIEWTHRLLALLVILSIGALAVLAWRKRAEPGVSGPGGVVRPAVISFVLVIAVALLGMVTVKLGNTTLATVAHWTLAMALLGVLAAAAVRAGAFGGDSARLTGGSARSARSLGAGAAMAFIIVVLGGLVAKYPGGAVACPGFPLCGTAPADVAAGARYLQMTHRGLAFLLMFHVVAVTLAMARRSAESVAVKRAGRAAAVLVLLQIGFGAAMIMSALAPTLRALHQATGVAVWLTMFLATYLARVASRAAPSDGISR